MADLLNKMRRKPKHVRDNLAFGIAGGFSAVLAVVWFWFGSSSSLIGTEITTPQNPEVFSTFLNQLKEQTASLGDSIESVSTTTSATGVGVATTTNSIEGWETSTATSSNKLPEVANIMIVPTPTSTATSSVNMLY